MNDSKNYGAAIPFFDKAIEIDPKRPESWYGKGYALHACTGMSIQHKFIKKEIISGQYEKKSTGTFNETSNVTSTKGIAIKK